jgi:hypothetical protein
MADPAFVKAYLSGDPDHYPIDEEIISESDAAFFSLRDRTRGTVSEC